MKEIKINFLGELGKLKRIFTIKFLLRTNSLQVSIFIKFRTEFAQPRNEMQVSKWRSRDRQPFALFF